MRASLPTPPPAAPPAPVYTCCTPACSSSLQEKRLQLYDVDGTLMREWVLDAVIRYIRVAGGPPGKEGLLLGLKSGAVLKIFVDNAFPIPLIKHTSGIRCVCHRAKGMLLCWPLLCGRHHSRVGLASVNPPLYMSCRVQVVAVASALHLGPANF